MSYRTFNNLFLPLMVLAAISAFFIPIEYTNFFRGRIDGIFSPVASPLRRLVEVTSTRLGFDSDNAQLIRTSVNVADSAREIDRLRVTVASLTIQIKELQRQSAGRELGGELRGFARPCKVITRDLGDRDSLIIQATSRDGITIGMPVVCQQGLVGKISAVGIGGAQVQLITDVGSRSSGQFGKFSTTPEGSTIFTPITTSEPLVEGRGHGAMAITNITTKEVNDTNLQSGDWLVLSDRDMWPATVNGQRLGQIVSIGKLPKSALFADIQLRPLVNLDTLREVMVVTNQPHVAPPAKPAPEPKKPAPKPTVQTTRNDKTKTSAKPAG